jgi:hypothetical protein
VLSNNDYTCDCKFPNSFLTAYNSGFFIVYRNETNIEAAFLDLDLDIIWLKEWFIAVDDLQLTCLVAS